MENFEKKIFNLVKSEFNLNVYGSNGCGKSTTLTKIFEKKRLLSTNHIYLKLHNFINIKEFFIIIQDHIQNWIKQISVNVKNVKIEKWNDFYEFMDYFKDIKFSFYLIIDEILDIESILFFKKYISKLLAINRTNPNFKIIFISNFDMTKSELSNYIDFSNIFSIPFPSLTKAEIRKIIDDNLYNPTYNSKN
jgi:Cdc6-like AAA superfamily ATPase